MESEEARLYTFRNWPQDHPISPLDMVTAGFYFHELPDKVKCFCCHGIVMSWDVTDIPLEEHRKHFPRCNFVNNPDGSGNIRFRFGRIIPAPSDLIPSVPSARMDNLSTGGRTALYNGRGNGRDRFDSMQADSVSYNVREMNMESKRLETLQSWPMKEYISIQAAAKDGLYYTYENDKLRCYFCKGSMINWERYDKPPEEHRKHFSENCPFIKGHATNNVPIGGPVTNGHSGQTHFDALNIITERPKHQSKAAEETRLATFNSWIYEHVQPKARLAKAGFFFTGTGDQVRCFFCNLGLKNWDVIDDPWEEHRRWAEKCGFLKMVSTAPDQIAESMDGMVIDDNTDMCRVCRRNEANTVFLPCGHILTCDDCTTTVTTCPRCHQHIDATVKAFFG